MADENQSEFKLFSIGVVVSSTGSMIEVYPGETMPLVSGPIADFKIKNEAKNIPDALGVKRSSTSTGKATVRAEWLPLGDPNRVTAPNVMPGERVQLHRLGDSEKYYWTTLMNDWKIRRAEAVQWRFGNMNLNEDKMTEAGDNTSHWACVDGITGVIQLHTSKNKGEAVIFDMIFDMRKGTWILKDDRENYIKTDNTKDTLEIQFVKKITLKDKKGNSFVLDTSKDTITITSNKKIVLDTPNAQTVKDLEVKGNLVVRGDCGINGNLGVNGDIAVGGGVRAGRPMKAPAFIRV